MNKKVLNLSHINKNNLILLSIIIFSILIDKLFHLHNFYIPKWDQGYHLSNLFRTYNIFEEVDLNNFDWWNNLWRVSDTYRGPLTYICSSIFLKIFGKSYENSLLSNHIFSIITILCIFNLSKEIGNEKVGLWGSVIFALNPYIFDQRVDYLIDLSQVCIINLNFYILYKLLKSKTNFLLSLFLGITLGFAFLTKPTGLLFLLLPYSYALYYLSENLNSFKKKLLYLIIITSSFLIVIWPWLSINWLTIFTSILNSWQWGIKYQDGLEANTFEGLIFYPKIITKLIGPYILGSFFVIGSIDLFKSLRNHKFKFYNFNGLRRIDLFLISMPINILIICTFMSTKDLRFILPIFPSLCIFSGLFLEKLKKNNLNKFYKIFIFTIILSTLILHLNNQKNTHFIFKKNTFNSWPHKEIVEELKRFSPNLKTVIGVLPDTKELNTFNLAAEAELQNSNLHFRQIISNEESYKEDLNRFNWFIIKDGEQGIMSSNAKLELSKLVEESSKFKNFKSWELPDGSKAKLFKRKKINESISIIRDDFSPLKLDLIFSDNGLTLDLKGNVESVSKSNLLLDARSKDKKYEINIALPEIINMSDKNIQIIKRINFDQKLDYETLNFDYLLISKENEEIPISLDKVIFNKEIIESEKNTFEINKVKELEKMGKLLKYGEFDKLFNLVGLINQTDPDQEYLKDSEKIFKYRYKLNNRNPYYLYNIAIAQVLQRKSIEAADTLEKLIKIDKNNSNLYLAKSVVDIYNFNPRQAEINIQKAININNNPNLNSTINTIKIISNIINLRISSLTKI